MNLVGFGIIIPLLPFYAQTFGASPLAIGLLFASFSLSQLVASPVLGDLSDRWGRRPILIFSLARDGGQLRDAGVGAQPGHAVYRADRGRTVGRQYHHRARLHRRHRAEENRAKAFGLLGAAFGLGFIVGPGLGARFCRRSATRRRSGRRR